MYYATYRYLLKINFSIFSNQKNIYNMKKLLISIIFLVFSFQSFVYSQEAEKSKNKFSIGFYFGSFQRNVESLNTFLTQNNMNPTDNVRVTSGLNICYYTQKWHHHIDIQGFANVGTPASSFAIPRVDVTTSTFSYSLGRFIKNTPSYSILAFGGLGYALHSINLERGTTIASFPTVANNIVLYYNRVTIDRISLNAQVGVGIYKKLFKERFLVGGRVNYTNGFYAGDTWKFYRGNAVSDVPDLGLGILSYQLGVNYMILR
jgi:hypothetical protein